MRAESTVFRPPSSKLDLVGRRLHRPARGLRSLRLVEASLHLGVITPAQSRGGNGGRQLPVHQSHADSMGGGSHS